MQSRREWLSGFLAAPLARAAPERPNMVFILLDDLRWDEIRCGGHPYVDTPNIDRIAREGALFRNAFVTTPLCSPSRASFLTGQYAHTHGVTDNVDRSPLSHRMMTFPRMLHDSGYETGFIGKFHMGVDDSPRPGFDRWVSFKGQGSYLSPPLNVDGKPVKSNGYVTDIFTDYAEAFLKQDRRKPFFLWFAHKAVHPELVQNADGSINDPNGGKFIPAERHKKLYADRPVVRRPNVAHGPQGKPALQRKIDDLPPLSPQTGTDDETVRNRLRMTVAVDESVGRLRKALEAKGQWDNTVFVFTSDEGYFLGEHGLSAERRLAYEESARIPLIMRYPRLIRPGSFIDPMALNIDIAPTMLDFAGLQARPEMQGRSLLPLLKGNAKGWRTSFLIEYYSDKVFPRMVNMGYQCVRTERWKYIRYTDLRGMDELYDLKADPYEEHNRIADPAAAAELKRLQIELQRLRA